jgi:hypothetical protein
LVAGGASSASRFIRHTAPGEPLFPLELRLKRPTARDITERFTDVRDWVRDLQAGSRERRGFGYAITWQRVNNRVQGANDLPAGITVPTEEDGLRLIGRSRDVRRFRSLMDETLSRYPDLRDWLARRPLTALRHAGEWPQILAVLDHFVARPRPGVYQRQLDIPGVDTKFIGNRRRLLGELLDRVLPAEAIDSGATGAAGFEQRYGLRPRPSLVRFRVLDPALAVGGFADISVPFEAFADWRPAATHVFVTENEINGLAFPTCPGGIVIFGLGYGVEPLAAIPWLQGRTIHYWGDIDTHGFAILSRLRSHLPLTRSFLMDRNTLDAHGSLCGQEPATRRFTGRLDHLTVEEQALYTALRDNTLGDCLRLEQERIAFGHVQRAVEGITGSV